MGPEDQDFKIYISGTVLQSWMDWLKCIFLGLFSDLTGLQD